MFPSTVAGEGDFYYLSGTLIETTLIAKVMLALRSTASYHTARRWRHSIFLHLFRSCVRGFVKETKECCFAFSKFLRKAIVAIDMRQTIPLQYIAESLQIIPLAPCRGVKSHPLGASDIIWSNRALYWS